MKNALSPQKSPGYTLVAECLYRNDASGIYYALIKRGGKQIRRSLKTSDRKLAERKLKTRMVLQVHDELLFEVPFEEKVEIAELVKTEMEGVVKLNVPLIADLGFGPNWRDL